MTFLNEKPPLGPDNNPGEDRYLLSDVEKKQREEIRKKVVTMLLGLLKEAGFKKQASTWRRELSDVIQVVNLQRSRWDFSYYINIGVLIKEFAPDITNPDEVKCHYRARFESVLTDDKVEDRRLQNLLDFEDESATPEQKIAALKRELETKLLPILEKLKTIDDFKDVYAKAKIRGSFPFWLKPEQRKLFES